MALIDSSTNKEAVEVDAGAAREAIANDVKFSDLWSRRPFVESSILASGWTPPESSSKRAAATEQQLPRRDALNAGPALQRLRNHLERTKELRHMPFGSVLGGGSNNWAIAPSRSVTGNALLSNDPHQPMRQPATFYLAHLDAKTKGTGQIHAAGATVAGMPWVVLGQNENIAWGSTDTFFDMTDVYIEELVKDTDGNAMGVMFKGEVVPFTRVQFPVRFNDGSTEDQELLFVPHHGPVRGEIDVDNDVAITLRWTAQDADTDIEYIGALNTAGSVMEARTALENATTAGLNFVVIDTEGNIGWFPYSRLPKRTWATNLSGDAPPWLPLDGRCATPERCYEWTEYFELTELPQALNPSEGFIATANNDMTGALFDGDPTNDGYPPFQTDVEPGIRHARIVKLIEEIGSEHSTATMQRIQSDVYSLFGELNRPGFLAIAESDMTDTLSERAQKIVDALKAWNFTCPTGLEGPYTDSPLTDDTEELRESSGCAAYHAALYRCWFPVLLGESGRVDPNSAYFYSVVDPSQLQAGDVYWDNPATSPEIETKYQGIAGCFDDAGRILAEDVGLGDDETKWAWGRVQGLSLSSDLSTFGISTYDNPPPGETLFANDGGHYTVDPTTPFAPDGVQREGASMRFVCEVFPSGPSCTIQLPGGQSSDIDSPYNNYEDLLFKWLENEPIDLVFDIDEAKANAVRTVTFD
jgi:penicillin amidase